MIQLDFEVEGFDIDYTVKESQPVRVRTLYGCDNFDKKLIVIMFNEKGERVDLVTYDKPTSQGIEYSIIDNHLGDKSINITFGKVPNTVHTIRLYLVTPESQELDIDSAECYIMQRGLMHCSRINTNNEEGNLSILLCEFNKKETWELNTYKSYSKYGMQDLINPNFTLDNKLIIKPFNGKPKEGILARILQYFRKFT